MTIQRAEIFHIKIRMPHPFETSFGVIADRPAVIVKLTSDSGLVGYGESSTLDMPMSEPETTAEAVALLQKKLSPLIGMPINKDLDVVKLSADDRNPVSFFGIEGAYLDLVAQSQNISLHHFFGAVQSKVEAGESVGLHPSLGEVLAEVEKYVSAGLSRVKVKIAHGRDLDIIREVRNAFPSLCLGADANTDYTRGDIDHLAKLAEYDLAFVEQPFKADDYASHAALRRTGIKICLDETIRDFETCRRAIQEKACDMVNIKPARIGSFRESKKIHDLCVENHIPLFGGGRLETGIGKTANAAFYALPGFTEASDITPPQDYLESDVIIPPFEVKEGIHEISNLPGLGVTINEEKLKGLCVEHYTFPR